jgi:ArsR family transcriptional regulator
MNLALVEDRAPVDCCASIAATSMTQDEAEVTARLFRALADPARIRILNLLLSAEGEVCACEISPTIGLTQSTVSHHLKKLLESGLVHREERGTWAYYSVDQAAMARLRDVADAEKGTRWPK